MRTLHNAVLPVIALEQNPYNYNDTLPPAFRIACAHGDSDSLTYSVSAFLTN